MCFMAAEYEWKFSASRETLESLQKVYPGGKVLTMETTYYDTPSGALSARRYTLRRRYENGESVCTLKIPAPQGGRWEFEINAPDIRSAIPLLCQAGAPESLPQLIGEGIRPICGAKFTRQAIMLSTKDGTAELALDAGILTGGGRELPLFEVELEHKTGSLENTRLLALEIAQSFHLEAQPLSKFRRALGLYRGENV